MQPKARMDDELPASGSTAEYEYQILSHSSRRNGQSVLSWSIVDHRPITGNTAMVSGEMSSPHLHCGIPMLNMKWIKDIINITPSYSSPCVLGYFKEHIHIFNHHQELVIVCYAMRYIIENGCWADVFVFINRNEYNDNVISEIPKCWISFILQLRMNQMTNKKNKNIIYVHKNRQFNFQFSRMQWQLHHNNIKLKFLGCVQHNG